MQNNQIKMVFAGILGILILIFSFSISMLTIDKIKKQIDPSITYGTIVISKLPYPEISLKDVVIGDAKIAKVILHLSLPSIFSFSHKIGDIELQNLHIQNASQISSLQDFHKILRNIWIRKNDISNIDVNNIVINKIIIPSATLSCGSIGCNIRINFGDASDMNLDVMQSASAADIIDLSASYSFYNHKINIEEKYDTKSGNFLGAFSADQTDGKKWKFAGEVVGNATTTHFRNISIDSDICKGAADYAVFADKNAHLKANIDYLEVPNISDFISFVKSGSEGLFVDVKIASAKMADEKISDIKFIANSDENSFNIADFSGKLDGESKFSINGKLSSSFDGSLELNYADTNKLLTKFGHSNLTSESKEPQNLQLSSAIHIGEKIYHFNNIDAKIAGQVTAVGQFGVRFISDTPRVLIALDIDNLDSKNKSYPVVNNLFSYLTMLSSSMKDSHYMDKWDPIKNLGYKLNADLYFTNAQIGQYKIDNMRSNFRVKDAYIDLLELSMIGDKIDLSVKGELQAWGLKPILFGNIYGAKIDGIDYNHQAFMKYLTDNLDLKKLHLNLSVALDKYSTIKKFEAQNLRATLSSDDLGGIKISNFIFDIFGGRVISTSYLSLHDLGIDGVFGYNNFFLEPIVSYLSGQESALRGVASANGKFHSNIDSYDIFSKNLEFSGNYIAKFITLQNFGIDDFIEQITKKNYDAKARIEYDGYYAVLKGSTEIPLLSGSVDVKGGSATLADTIFTTKFSSGKMSAKLNLNGTFDVGTKANVMFEFQIPEGLEQKDPMAQKIEPKKLKANMSLEGSIFAPSRSLDRNDLKKQMGVVVQ
jgi:hypothetical protein